MKDEVMVDTIEIDDKEFFLVDKIDKYYFFAEINTTDNICILKNENNDLVKLDEDEIDKALVLFNNKYSEE